MPRGGAAQTVKGHGNLGEIMNKPMVEVNEAQELLKVLFVVGYRPISKCFNLLRVHPELPLKNDNAQVFHFKGLKDALLGFEEKLVKTQSLEDMMSHDLMGGKITCKDQNIIHVDNN